VSNVDDRHGITVVVMRVRPSARADAWVAASLGALVLS
jgi:hypothetical protein